MPKKIKKIGAFIGGQNGNRHHYGQKALLQSRKAEAGSIARLSAPDVETLVCRALREAHRTDQETAQTDHGVTDHELISQHVERVMVHADQITVTMRSPEAGQGQSEAETEATSPPKLTIPFSLKRPPMKGIAHAPAEHGTIDPRTQDTLLQAIARSRSWMDAILAGKTASFDEIASAEGLAERHVRRLVRLAFLSPKIIHAIASGTAPAGLTVSSLTQALPHAWTAQEQILGLS